MTWRSDISYHTVATVVISPDNSTNSTRTSTIPGQLPSPAAAGDPVHLVNGSVFSTDVAGTEYNL